MDTHHTEVSYIPRSDPEALQWLENFFNTLLPRPSAFGVDQRDFESLGHRISEFRAWLALADSPDARAAAKGVQGLGEAGGAVTEKVRARNAAMASAQLLVRQIEANALTTDDDRRRLGLPSAATKE